MDDGVSLLQRQAVLVNLAEDPAQDEKQELWAKLVSSPSVQGDTAIVPALAEAAPQTSNQIIQQMDKGITHIAVKIQDGAVEVMSAPEVTQMDADIVGMPRGMALQWVGHHCEFSEVRAGGAAARVGIRAKDRLLAINGVQIATFDDVFRILPRSGDFKLTYARSAKMLTGHLTNHTKLTPDAPNQDLVAAAEAPDLPEEAPPTTVALALPAEDAAQQLEAAAQPSQEKLVQPVVQPPAPEQSPPAEQPLAELPLAEAPPLTAPVVEQSLAVLPAPDSQAAAALADYVVDALSDADYRELSNLQASGMVELVIKGEPRGFAMRWRKTAPLILSVAHGSPADKAGLASGDRILQINGQQADSLEHTTELIPAQGSFTIRVVRSAAQHLALMSSGDLVHAVSSFDVDRWQQISGVFRISVRGPTRGLKVGYAENVGPVVRSVQRSSPADVSGFEAGDVIGYVNGASVASAAQMSSLLESKDAVVQIDLTRGVN